jgi:predicted nucleotidyltransferase
MNKILHDNLDKLRLLCEEHNVKMMYVFGSVCTENFKEESDIDFLISFEGVPLDDYADNYFELYYKLCRLFQREIDLVTENSLSNPYFIKGIGLTKQLIYAA